MWNQILQEAIEARHHLHRFPELTWNENDTAAFIREQLSAWGIAWEACTKTGTIARLGVAKTGKHIALRGDIDALPVLEKSGVEWSSERSGCMHACGHDGHTAALLATARWLHACKDALKGPVSLLFQPAEEGGHGALRMIEAGALRGIDEIYGWHNWPAVPFGQALCPEGAVMSANSTFTMTITGVGGHGSQPEACRDPLLAGAAVVMAAQQIVSRRLPPQVSAVVSVTSFDAKNASNVIPASVELGGGIRASDTQLRDQVSELLSEIARDTARAYGCEADVSHAPCYGATINHQRQSQNFKNALESEMGEAWCCQEVPTPIMASEDFSYFLEQVPGAFALIGAAEKDAYNNPCHSAYYDFNDRLIETVVRLYARLVDAPLPE